MSIRQAHIDALLSGEKMPLVEFTNNLCSLALLVICGITWYNGYEEGALIFVAVLCLLGWAVLWVVAQIISEVILSFIEADAKKAKVVLDRMDEGEG